MFNSLLKIKANYCAVVIKISNLARNLQAFLTVIKGYRATGSTRNSTLLCLIARMIRVLSCNLTNLLIVEAQFTTKFRGNSQIGSSRFV